MSKPIFSNAALGVFALVAFAVVTSRCSVSDGSDTGQETAAELVNESEPMTNNYPSFVEQDYASDLMADEFKGQDYQAYDEVRQGIRSAGFRCDTISGMRRTMVGEGIVVICNSLRYEYVLKDKGGRLEVTVKD